MKIGIDISQVIFGTGVSVYTKSLVTSLLRIDQENRYILYGGSLRRTQELKEIAQSFKGRVESKVFPYPPTLAEFIWNTLHTFPIEKLVGEIDILHTSDWVEPPTLGAFKVTTVHDLYPFKFPKLLHPKILDTHRRKMSWIKNESKRVITPSLSTKTDLVNLGIDESIIRVIPEAPSLTKSTDQEVEEIRKKYGLEGEYLISIGITPLKNTTNIIKAFHLAKPGRDLKLVLVGRPSNLNIEEERNLRILGHVPHEDLASLLTGSKALVFPSLYEGFGIPILDAFFCGVPVVTSNVSSMPEVAGDAAILVNPEDVNSIADGITKALKGPKGLIDKGYERVKRFSWDKTAEKTLEVYNEAKL